MPDITASYARDLDLNLVRVFAVVAEEGSITRAAARLYVTQPAVSAAMRRLAAFVGMELFARQGRGLVLTPRGRALAAAVQQHLGPLVAETLAAPLFDPRTSTAVIRLGLCDPLDAVLLPRLLALLRAEAPRMQLVVLPAQFRTVEELLLSAKVDLAITIADELPRSIRRQPLAIPRHVSGELVVLYDARCVTLPRRPRPRDYFAHEHVVVSYAGDLRGIVEDAHGGARIVRLSVPAFSYVADAIDGAPLLATIPRLLAQHLVATRPYLRMAPLPFALDVETLDLLWLRSTDEDEVATFARALVMRAALAMARPRRARATRARPASRAASARSARSPRSRGRRARR